MRHKRLSKRSRCELIRGGVAAVEFAIIAPLFLLLLAGIIEFGQAFQIEHMLSNAVRRGARGAVVDGSTNNQVVEMVQTHCQRTMGIAKSDVTVEVSINGGSGSSLDEAERGDAVSVTASVPFSAVGVGFFANMFSSTMLESSCIMEHE